MLKPKRENTAEEFRRKVPGDYIMPRGSPSDHYTETQPLGIIHFRPNHLSQPNCQARCIASRQAASRVSLQVTWKQSGPFDTDDVNSPVPAWGALGAANSPPFLHGPALPQVYWDNGHSVPLK